MLLTRLGGLGSLLVFLVVMLAAHSTAQNENDTSVIGKFRLNMCQKESLYVERMDVCDCEFVCVSLIPRPLPAFQHSQEKQEGLVCDST